MPQANASSASLPPPSHGSGSGWFATPFLYDSFIHYFTPVYPDAIQIVNLRPIVNRPVIAVRAFAGASADARRRESEVPFGLRRRLNNMRHKRSSNSISRLRLSTPPSRLCR